MLLAVAFVVVATTTAAAAAADGLAHRYQTPSLMIRANSHG
jgi:hypothetical protein